MDVPRLRGPKSPLGRVRSLGNAGDALESDSDEGFHAVDGVDLRGTTMGEDCDLNDKPNPVWRRGVAEGVGSSSSIANAEKPLRGECRRAIVRGGVGTLSDTPGNRSGNINCKRQSYTPVVATPSGTPSSRSKKRARYRRSQRARAKQLRPIVQDVEFDIQQKLAKADRKKMRLRSSTTCAPTLNPTSAESKQRNHSDAMIGLSNSPARLRSRRGGAQPSRLSNSSAPSRRKGTRVETRLCGLAVCGSSVPHTIGGGGGCEDCGDGDTHGIDELLCSACHRTLGFPVYHLGEEHLLLAMQWVQECRASNGGLPAIAVDSFKPSTACLCARTDCFYNKFLLFRIYSTKRRCCACGARNTTRWCSAGQRHLEYQKYFTGERGRTRTKMGMAATKEVMIADSVIFNACQRSFHVAVSSRWRPTLKVFLEDRDTRRAGRTRVFRIKRTKGNLLCPTYSSLRQQCARANATMEYWQGAFAESMPAVRFKGRGWDAETGQVDLCPETSVVLVSEHCIINSNGKTKKLTCSSSNKLASTRKCRNFKCAKRGKHCVAIACGCKGRCGRLAGGTVTPDPAPTSSDPDRVPTLYPSAGASGEGGDFNDDDRSERSLSGRENEDWERVSSSYDSDGWRDDTSSIQLGPEDVDLDEFSEDGV